MSSVAVGLEIPASQKEFVGIKIRALFDRGQLPLVYDVAILDEEGEFSLRAGWRSQYGLWDVGLWLSLTCMSLKRARHSYP